MKRSFYICLILFSQVCFSQTYIELPDSNAKWINIHRTFTGSPVLLETQIQYCASGIDTVINSNAYFIIDTCGGGYKGAMRNDNGRVHYVPKDSVNEFLLYDFTVNDGDSLYDVYIESANGYGALYDLKVDSGAVDSILIDGFYRKKISFWFGAYGWIEGIGNEQGLFWEPWGNISGYSLELFCMSVSNISVYPDAGFGICESFIGIEEELNEENDIMIFPNPTDNDFSLQTDLSIQELYIIDSRGNRIFETGNLARNAVIQLDTFSSGVYIIVIRTDNQIFTKKIIKK